MISFNDRMVKELPNEFAGTDRKTTAIFSDGSKYLLKFPAPMRKKHGSIFYASHVLSEYVACKIFKMLQIPVQEVLLGKYTYHSAGVEKTITACACRDVRGPGEQLIPLRALMLADFTSERTKHPSIADLIGYIHSEPRIDTEASIAGFYDQFIGDAFIGNTDRHTENWGFLFSGQSLHLSPSYDCAASLSPLVLDSHLSTFDYLHDALHTFSALRDASGRRISYRAYILSHADRQVDLAIARIVPRIDMPAILRMIHAQDGICEQRKALYCHLLQARYTHMLLPALKHVQASFTYTL